MRESIKQFVKMVSGTLPISEPVFEFGALDVSEEKGFGNLRPFFANKEYVGCDIREGPGVDRILDLHRIDLPSESVGTVLVPDTLEHVEFPRKAINEVHRILKANGIFVLSSVMKFPIHNFPSDYWRFTPEAFKSLLKPFAFSFVEFAGETKFPHTVVGVGCKGEIPEKAWQQFMREFRGWKAYWNDPSYSRLKELVRLFAPPILLHMYRKTRSRVKQ